jgi:hypothetical protein
LLLDIAPGHPQLLQDLYLDIKDVFLPPNAIYEIQPIDQTVIATFNPLKPKDNYMYQPLEQPIILHFYI